MIPERPADYRDVVHAARLGTRVIIAAGRPPCIRLRDDAARPAGRDYHTRSIGGLAETEPARRWLLAVIVCPGDTLAPVVSWLRKHRADPERVVVVLHPRADPHVALRPWYEAGFGDPVVIEAATFQKLSRPLGRFVNDWIYRDEKGAGISFEP